MLQFTHSVRKYLMYEKPPGVKICMQINRKETKEGEESYLHAHWKKPNVKSEALLFFFNQQSTLLKKKLRF